ncbi:Zn-ribbon domain-containing OB-fold protein [Paraburkholderia sp. MM5477-R1]|uniref:Zn-ribbon domain-containing OB-fold protein n=1 Tax=Paraburkholderia sp. MM5477-R1 TaxID=2991062 RepID=UPI003D22AD71
MTSTVAEREITDPAINPGDEPYFEAADQGKLLLKVCSSCGRAHHYPRSLCPFCWSTDLSWKDAAGTGEIYTYSVTRRGAGAPYCIAYVKLDEGPTMLTNIVDTDYDSIKIGQRVQVVFKRSAGGIAIPVFTPA